MPVCLYCLNVVESSFMVMPNHNECYHENCYVNLLKNKELKNYSGDFIDIFEPVDCDSSNNTISINSNKYLSDVYSTINKNILSSQFMDELTLEEIANTINGPAFAIDVAGNTVKLDKLYIIKQTLKKYEVKC